MKAIKSFLLRVLGQSLYLRITSKLYFIFFEMGWLKNNPNYSTHYFVKNLIKNGDCIIDIGANLGYYTRQFSKLAGELGRVHAVEPISLYRNILNHNIENCSNIQVFPFALGEREGMVTMGNPSSDRHRHGLMRVLPAGEASGKGLYNVPVKNPMQLFSGLESLDYIKCDIEGYEVPVFPAMKPLLEKYHPIVQIETEGDNLRIIFDLLKNLNYKMFYVEGTRLKPYTNPGQLLSSDLIGIPDEKVAKFKTFISQ